MVRVRREYISTGMWLDHPSLLKIVKEYSSLESNCMGKRDEINAFWIVVVLIFVFGSGGMSLFAGKGIDGCFGSLVLGAVVLSLLERGRHIR